MPFRFAAAFPTTAWTAIRAAQDHQSPEAIEAVNCCVAAYWKPMFCFLRAKGIPLQKAEDLTQEFFLQFFEHDWIRRAEQERGRFRTFLLTILTRFLSDRETDRAPRQKRFDDRMVAISALVTDTERSFEPPDNRTPEEVFMRQWAQAVLTNVRRCLESWCNARGRPDWYRMFCEVYLPAPGCHRVSQHALADRLHMTRDQVRYGLEEANRQFVEFLRAEVSDQAGTAEEIETEIRDLEELLVG